MTLPNFLSILRIFMTFLFVGLIMQEDVLLASIVFLVASFTDYFDGYLARKYNLITNFGKIIDPVADKFLVLSAFFVFSYLSIIPMWMVIIICAREVFVTVIRLSAKRKGQTLAAEKSGKVKTVAQMATILVILILLMTGLVSNSFSKYMISLLMWISVILTVYSGIQFLLNNKIIGGNKNGSIL